MERTKYRLTFILLGLFAISLQASIKNDVYNAYLNNRMPVWKSIIDQLNSQPDKGNELVLELVKYQYGYIGWCLINNRKDEALVYLKLAEENVKLLEAKRFELSLVNGYKSAFYGCHIALSTFSAPFLGPKSSACANQAIQLDPNQPFGYIQLGNVKFHSPSLMGGSKTEAISYYQKARTIMERKGNEIHGDWNYLSLMVTIAKAYESMGKLSKAKLMFEEILKFDSGFIWVRDDLYPELLRKF